MSSDEKPTSIWKKEMSFRRKPADERADDGSSESASTTGSIWKKELTLRKKHQDGPAEPEAAAAEPELDPAVAAALELIAGPAPAAAPEPAPAPAAAVEHSWLTKPLEEVSEPPDELAPEPVVEAAPAVDPVAEAPTLVSSPVALVPVERPAALEEVAPSVPEPELEAELALDLDLPVDAVAVPEHVALPTLPEPQDAMPEPPVPPAPAVEAAPPPAAEAKVPFYKRELSLKRGPREDKPKAEKAPRVARPKRERPEKAEAEDKVPFYKRQLSLRRSSQEWDAAEPVSEPKAKPKLKLKLPSLSRPSFSLPALGAVSANKIVGLKIGGSQIAAARVNNGASPELVQAVREPLEHGIVVSGELRDPEALAVALKEFFQRHKLPKRGVRLGIANNRIGVRTFDVTGIDDPKQLANAIRFRAQEVLPIPLEEAVLDYQILSESVNDDGQKVTRVMLVVAYRELVDRYVYACKKAGIQIVGIDLEAFALLRAVAAPHDPVPGAQRAALVAVSVGHDRSTFAVSDGRVCEFTRVLEWGGWALNIAIARALDASPSEVEPIKRALSLAGNATVPEGFNQEQVATAQEAARRQLQTFARELVSSLQFYQNQPGSLSIGEIVLTGGTAHLPGLGAELERLIGVPVRVADPLTRLKVSKKAAEQEQVGSLAVAIGLGIDD